MKNIIITLFVLVLLGHVANAQYCGNSGPTICDSIVLPEPGFSPPRDELPPLINGKDTTTVIYFKNYDKVLNGVVTVNSLRIDSIENLPAGICWSTNIPNNTFGNQQNGCIKLTGIACAPPGQYKLRIIVSINGTLNNINVETQGLKYFVRVKNEGDADTPLDTLQGAFYGYGGSATNCSIASIQEPMNSVNSLRITPNPLSTKAQVSFFSSKSGMMTERLTNLLGSEVYRRQVEVKAGNNVSSIDRDNLSPGVYFYSIGEGKNYTTKRLVISE